MQQFIIKNPILTQKKYPAQQDAKQGIFSMS